MEQFPERLRRLRDRNGLKRYKLSELCGLSPDMVRKYENGESKPSIDALIIISDFFEVSTDYMLGRTDYPCVLKPYQSEKNF